METKDHPKLWLAYVLALVTGQSGLYHLYLGRSGSAVVMTGALVMSLAIWLAAPSQLTFRIILGVAIILTAVLVVDLVRMRSLVTAAHRDPDVKQENLR